MTYLPHAETTGFDRLLSPFQLRGHTLRNRMVTTGHSIMLPWHPASNEDQYVAYCRRRAAGGAALLIVQPLIIEPFHDWPRPVIGRLRKLADAVHEEGAKLTIQVVSFGRQIGSAVHLDERAMWSFNGGQDEFGEAAHRMTSAEVELMVQAHGRLAQVVTEAGLDGVELHGAHGYLLQQSYSPWGNGRDDEWGEPLAFSRAVLAAVREGLGEKNILGWRMTMNDMLRADENGLTEDQLDDTVRALVALKQIDLLNISIGTKAPAYSQASVANYRYPEGFDLPYAARLREVVGDAVAIVGVGGITDVAVGEQALADGICDLVGLTRTFLSDPDTGLKIARGDAARVRRCVRANECNNRRVDGKPVACFHNPEMSREQAFAAIPAITRRKHVVVVGAGPAGLAAAETAARRGHAVTVFEATDQPGGRLLAVRDTTAKSLLGTIEWLVAELGHHGVQVHLGARVSAAEIVALGADEVVVATGARHDLARHRGLSGAGAVSVDDALSHGVAADRVLVLDRTGANDAGLLVELLAAQGKSVTYLTPFERIVTNAGYTSRLDLIDVFRRAANVSVLTALDVRSFEQGRATLIDKDGLEVAPVDADVLVVAVHPIPQDALVAELMALGVAVHTVGDVIAPRGAMIAIREGTLLAQTF